MYRVESANDAFDDESRVLDVLAVRILLLPRILPEDDARIREVHGLVSKSPRWRSRGDLGEATAYENLRALPRAWLAGDVRRLAPEEILATLQRRRLPDGSTLDPKRTALVEEDVALGGSAPVVGGTVVVDVVSGNELVVECRSPSPAFLVLSDVYYPGWVAFVNDVRTPVHRTDYALHGVALPAGTSRVRMVFEPRSAQLGAAGSTAAALALMALLAAGLLRRSATRVRGTARGSRASKNSILNNVPGHRDNAHSSSISRPKIATPRSRRSSKGVVQDRRMCWL